MKGLHFDEVWELIIDGEFTIENVKSNFSKKFIVLSLNEKIICTMTEGHMKMVEPKFIPINILNQMLSLLETEIEE